MPQVRDGSFYPSVLEKRLRSERSLKLALAEIPDGKVLPKTRSQWRKLHLQGWVDYCNSATRAWLAVDSQPEEPGTITMSVALLKQADSAHLRGFEITPAGAPNPVSRP